MAWVKVPPENHPVFLEALPKDPRVETMKMFGGVAARVNGNVFAGLFGRSTMIWLGRPSRVRPPSADCFGSPHPSTEDGRGRRPPSASDR